MSALSAARNTPAEGLTVQPVKLNFPVKGSTTIYAGSLVGLNAGYLVPMSAATGLVCVGRAEKTVDNSTGSDGDLTCDVNQGVFKWDNSSSTDLIAAANVGATVYAVDDHTVALTDGNGARSPAGRVVAVDSSGVQVDTYIGQSLTGAQPAQYANGVIAVPVDLATAANTGVAARITPGFAGRIKKMSFQVVVPTTTGSKAGTLTPKIGSTALTGGVIALASNTDTGTAGANKEGTAVTANNVFSATDELTAVWSSVTAFAEGSGVLFFHLG